MVNIIPRSEWTSEPNGWASTTSYGGPLDPNKVETVYLHYPADGAVIYKALSKEQVKDRLNAYRRHHLSKGWSDIGYPYAIDQSGNAWEAAGDSYISAHTAGQNDEAIAFLLILGNDEDPTAAMIRTVNELYAQLRKDKFPNLKQILPHSAAQATSCPGDKVRALIAGGAFTGAATTAPNPSPPTNTGGSTVAGMVSPFEGRVTAEYMGYPGHAGIDIAPPTAGQTGRPVYAAYAGTVRKAVSWAGAGNRNSTWAPGRTGNGVLIVNPDGEAQGYNHMRPVVREGQKVSRGQLIGHNDRSGNMTGPHLHFEVWRSANNSNSHRNPRVDFNHHGVAPGSKPRTSGGGGGSAPSAPSGPTYARLVVDGVVGPVTWRATQVFLARARGGPWYTGRIDGDPGPMTRRALQRFLADRGHYSGRIDADLGPMSRRAWQSFLKAQGFYSGRIDGDWGPMTRRAWQTFLNDWRKHL